MKNKKGLSAVVTTLIIILLVIVAIGIVWSVVKGMIDDTDENIIYGAECLQVSLGVVSATHLDNENYSITTERSAGGDLPLRVKIVFSNEDESEAQNYDIEFNALEKKTQEFELDLEKNATEVTPVAYFTDDEGNEKHLCSEGTSFTIVPETA